MLAQVMGAHPVYYIHVSTMCPSCMMTKLLLTVMTGQTADVCFHMQTNLLVTLFHSIAENLIHSESNNV